MPPPPQRLLRGLLLLSTVTAARARRRRRRRPSGGQGGGSPLASTSVPHLRARLPSPPCRCQLGLLRLCFHGGAWTCPLDTASVARKSRPRALLHVRPQRCRRQRLVMSEIDGAPPRRRGTKHAPPWQAARRHGRLWPAAPPAAPPPSPSPLAGSLDIPTGAAASTATGPHYGSAASGCDRVRVRAVLLYCCLAWCGGEGGGCDGGGGEGGGGRSGLLITSVRSRVGSRRRVVHGTARTRSGALS